MTHTIRQSLMPPARRLRWLYCIAVALLPGPLTACISIVDPQTALATVDYRVEKGGPYVIDVLVNGEGPFAFAVDTGASMSVVYEGLRKKLAMEVVAGRNVLVHGVAASATFPLVRARTISVDGAIWHDVQMASMPMNEQSNDRVLGILGVDFLRRYTVEFVTDQKRMRLYEPAMLSKSQYVGWVPVPLTRGAPGGRASALYFFESLVDGAQINAMFDLGAGVNIVNWPAARALRLDRNSSRLRETEPVLGVMHEMPDVMRFVARRIAIGRVGWRNQPFLVADLQIFTTLGFEGDAAGLLGAGLFARHDFIIDFARPRLLVNIGKDRKNQSLVKQVGTTR